MLHVNRLSTICLVAVCSLFLPACWPFGSDTEKNQEKSKAELVIINVLDKAEYQDCHIAGSINVTFDEFESKIPTLAKQNHYVLYCADYMCMSSSFCAKLMIDAGFKHVWAYEGGMAEWYQKGYAYEGPAQLEYLHSENENLAGDEQGDVPTISAEELKEKIEKMH
ncbi:MAG: rhodanese-like domain-containing protein [Candidatus Chromulinivorax sp.]